MPALDSFVGLGATPSPYSEMKTKYEELSTKYEELRAQSERFEWTEAGYHATAQLALAQRDAYEKLNLELDAKYEDLSTKHEELRTMYLDLSTKYLALWAKPVD